jgi:hypothetical protein
VAWLFVAFTFSVLRLSADSNDNPWVSPLNTPLVLLWYVVKLGSLLVDLPTFSIQAYISAMALSGHLRDPLSLNPKSQWLAFTSRFPEWSTYFHSNLANSSSREILSLASKFLLLPPCMTVVVDTFRPLLLDLCARWLESSDALEDKLSALCFLLQPHAEIFPCVTCYWVPLIDSPTPFIAFFQPF